VYARRRVGLSCFSPRPRSSHLFRNHLFFTPDDIAQSANAYYPIFELIVLVPFGRIVKV